MKGYASYEIVSTDLDKRILSLDLHFDDGSIERHSLSLADTGQGSRFNVNDSVVLDNQVQFYASAYLAGLETQENE